MIYPRYPTGKKELLRWLGDPSQIAGVKRYICTEGGAHGLEAIDVNSGSGLVFTVLPGRGMDIAHASYRGIPLSYIAKPGLTSASLFEYGNSAWLRSFAGGLISTCGLSNVGNPCDENLDGLGPQHYALHGRIGAMPAEQVSATADWDEKGYVFRVSGLVREAQLRGEYFSMRRTITCRLGESRFTLEDSICNEDGLPHPLMIMYHINFGYPLLSPSASLTLPESECFCDDPVSEANKHTACSFTEPEAGVPEQLFFHKLTGRGKNVATLFNNDLQVGVSVGFDSSRLPFLTEWKMMGERDYVVGIEPGNCLPRGRVYHREKGWLEMLEPGQEVRQMLEIGVISD
jgi:hypothetical protein